MALFKIFALCAIIVFAEGCNFEDPQFTKTVAMQCATKSPALMIQIATHMGEIEKDPSRAFDMICGFQADIVQVFECVMDKMMSCMTKESDVPKQAMAFVQSTFSRDHISSALKFICKHRKTLSSQCLNMQPLMTCQMESQQQLERPKPSDMFRQEGLTPIGAAALCSAMDSMKQCLHQNRGSCSNEVIVDVEKMMDIFFPMLKSVCPKPKVETNLAKSALSRILVQGHPLNFKSHLMKPYIIKN